jgi:hypothetical protein
MKGFFDLIFIHYCGLIRGRRSEVGGLKYEVRSRKQEAGKRHKNQSLRYKKTGSNYEWKPFALDLGPLFFCLEPCGFIKEVQ